ncbi:hypothetical protein N0V90_002976 [Kalmusia sp. IMI 367209]|nr:hypothetical protein N0V90_002976 [Kalmusia sp. IMI 367209]
MIINALGRSYNRLCILIRHTKANTTRLLTFLSSRISERQIRPKPGWSDFWILSVRFVAIGLITTGIIWGATGFRVYLKSTAVFWYDVDADLQLALLGFFNKMLDVLLVSSLEYTASVLITTWMTAERTRIERGATFGDFELKNELTKPWMTIWAFVWRSRRFKWNYKSLFRFLLCLCISICVLLQGLALNTIAIPKRRWYPNNPIPQNGFSMTSRIRNEMTIKYPKVFLQEIHWSMHMKAGLDNIGNEGAPEWAFALSASRSLDGLSDIVPVSSVKEKGWQLVHGRDLGGTNRWTGLNTNFNARKPVESLSIIDRQVWQVYDWLRERGHGLTTASTGWTGNLSLIVPVLNTVCKDDNGANGISEGSMSVTPPDDKTPGNSNFTVRFGPTSAQNKGGVECSITFRQALHSFGMWIVDMKGADVSQNHYSSKYDERLTYEKSLQQDHKIALALAIQTQGVLARMDQLTTGKGIAKYLLSISRKLQQGHPGIQSDAHGLAVVVAVLLQNLISYSDQTRPAIPLELPSESADIITCFPIQWQLYGSGPRLAWEWVAVFVLAVVLCSFCFGLWQTIWYWMAPGDWTEVPGMMVLAQASGPLQDIETSFFSCFIPPINIKKMGPEQDMTEPKNIVIVGGGIIGISTAYYLTRHPLYDPKLHTITVLEATRVASGSSGKGGGFIAEWATPKCLGPLSFQLHQELAKEHDGDKVWGHRNVFAAEIKLYGQDVQTATPITSQMESKAPAALDWLRPGSIQQYDEIGVRSNSGQVNPVMLTRTLAKLAEEKGVTFSLGASVKEVIVDQDKNVVKSVSFTKNEVRETINATDVLVAAGPWTPTILPNVSLYTPRGHSVIVKPTRPLSPYILFPDIQPAPTSSVDSFLSPDIYPRPADHLHAFDTVYASGPDDYEEKLPANSDDVELVEKKLEDVLTAIGSVSEEIYNGELVLKQACYKPQIRPHKEDEEVGPMVGPVGVKGLWVATGHDEWGIQNGPGTGLLMSEMIFEGKAHSTDASSLDPRNFLQSPASL